MTTSVDDTKALIRAASLTPIEHKILCDVILGECKFAGIESDFADLVADEIASRIKAHSPSAIEDVLRSIKADWRSIISHGLAPDTADARLTALVKERENGRCMLTPKDTTQIYEPVATYIISPRLCEILSQPPGHTAKSLLEAFLSPENADALRVALDRTQTTTENALLLSPSIADAFWGGKLHISKYFGDSPPTRYSEVGLQTTRKLLYGFSSTRIRKPLDGCDGKPIRPGLHPRDLETKCPSRLPLPSLFLLGLQEKFGFAKEQFDIEEDTLKPWPAAAAPKFWSRRWLLLFRSIWHCVPKTIRVWAYRRLVSSEPYVKLARLLSFSSFGLLLKHDKANEAAALELLEAEAPDVPVPLVFDTFEEDNGFRYVVLTRLPGVDVEQVFYRMSYPERHQLADDLAAALSKVRKIPNKSGHMFCGPAGGKLYDMHAGYKPCGPFDTEDQLHTSMTGGNLKLLKDKWPKAFARPHLPAFTHGDLYPGNIMIDAGRFSGLVDWERSGFYPAYWENCKAVRGAFIQPEVVSVWQRVWKDDYKDEVEMAMWWMDACPWGAPEMAPESGEGFGE